MLANSGLLSSCRSMAANHLCWAVSQSTRLARVPHLLARQGAPESTQAGERWIVKPRAARVTAVDQGSTFRQPGSPRGTHGFAPHPRGWFTFIEEPDGQPTPRRGEYSGVGPSRTGMSARPINHVASRMPTACTVYQSGNQPIGHQVDRVKKIGKSRRLGVRREGAGGPGDTSFLLSLNSARYRHNSEFEDRLLTASAIHSLYRLKRAIALAELGGKVSLPSSRRMAPHTCR